VTRRYVKKNVGELEALAAANRDDPRVIADIIAELRHRSVPKARKLLARLTGEPAAAPTAPRKASPKTVRAPDRRTGAKVGSDGPIVEAATAVTNPPVDRNLEQTYELLRETFTFEAEILARWGVTPTLPREIAQSVFAAWRKLLKSGPDERGRSLELLEQDMAKLASHDGSEF